MKRTLLLMVCLSAGTLAEAAITDYETCHVLSEYTASAAYSIPPSVEVDSKPSWRGKSAENDDFWLRYSTANTRWEFWYDWDGFRLLSWTFNAPPTQQDDLFDSNLFHHWVATPNTPTMDYLRVDCGPTFNAPARKVINAVNINGTPATDAAVVQFFNSIVVTDDYDGVIANFTHNAPAVFPLGETIVRFEAADSRGTVGAAETIVEVKDAVNPVITLNGSASVTIEVGSSWTDPGATATDNMDGNLTGSINVSGVVDTNTIGVYQLTYTVSDNAGNQAQVIRSVSVQDSTAPVVTPPAPITLAAVDANGVPATDSAVVSFLNGATVSDAVDGNGLTITHSFSGTHVPLGTTTVTFEATDNAGNTGSAQSTISVTDQTPPMMQLLGDASMVVTLGNAYVEPGVLASDNVDGDISNAITVTGTVNHLVAGFYQLQYEVADAVGNSAQITRGISVQDLTAPVITPPADITVEAKDPQGVAVTHSAIQAFLAGATVLDDVDGSGLPITNNAPAMFPVGVTTVQFSATDSAGNIGYAQATVTVTPYKNLKLDFDLIGNGSINWMWILLLMLTGVRHRAR